jgi:hypothetical protein
LKVQVFSSAAAPENRKRPAIKIATLKPKFQKPPAMRPSTPNECQIGIGFSQLSMTHFFVDSASAFNYTPRFRLKKPNLKETSLWSS